MSGLGSAILMPFLVCHLHARCRSTTIDRLTSSIMSVSRSAKELPQNQMLCLIEFDLIIQICHGPLCSNTFCAEAVALRQTVSWSQPFAIDHCKFNRQCHFKFCQCMSVSLALQVLSVSLALLLSGHLVLKSFVAVSV